MLVDIAQNIFSCWENSESFDLSLQVRTVCTASVRILKWSEFFSLPALHFALIIKLKVFSSVILNVNLISSTFKIA